MTDIKAHNFAKKKMLDIFCDVIDNYGDAGFSLRLARALLKRDISICFYCNNIDTLRSIISENDLKNPSLKLMPWPKASDYEPSPTVIEAFSCRLPEELNDKLRDRHSLVIELDYLTAEKFAEDCHMLSSSSDGIDSYFFFPGFTQKTGGVIFEKEFEEDIRKHRTDVLTTDGMKISLFSYENPRLKELLQELSNSTFNPSITVFAGKALDNLNRICNCSLSAGKSINLKGLHIKARSMCSQPEYDQILLSSDLNLVRGEESVVRAMLVGKPFLWHIYVQDEDAHLVKLNSFFDRIQEYCATDKDAKDVVERVRALHLFYNGSTDVNEIPQEIFNKDFMNRWKKLCEAWSAHLLSLGSLTDNLLNFIKKHQQ